MIRHRYTVDKPRSGTFSLFIFRGWGQSSQQATVEGPRVRPLLIPRTGTSASTGTPTFIKKSRGQ